jgi:hypothetical protein
MEAPQTMRVRLALCLTLLLSALFASAPAALASDGRVLAQSPSSDSTDSGSKGDEAKTDSGKEAKAPAEEEEGPPWTYQMARITFAMLFLVFLGMGISYWKLIGSRQRGAA